MKSKKILAKELTRVFNAWVRDRDRDKGCISCLVGGVENAGHFISVGADPRPSLRYNEDNVHGQCIRCNFTLAGNPVGYRAGLIRRYGPEIIKRLEITRALRHDPWTPFHYMAMIKKYGGRCEG